MLELSHSLSCSESLCAALTRRVSSSAFCFCSFASSSKVWAFPFFYGQQRTSEKAIRAHFAHQKSRPVEEFGRRLVFDDRFFPQTGHRSCFCLPAQRACLTVYKPMSPLPHRSYLLQKIAHDAKMGEEENGPERTSSLLPRVCQVPLGRLI